MSRTTYITAAAILAALLTTTIGTVSAQETRAYLKKPNPDELFVALLHDEKCPGAEDSYQSIIDGELVRARIKESTSWPSYGVLFLMVDIDCFPIERDGINTGFFFNVRPEFGMELSVEREDRDFPRLNVERDYIVTIVNDHGRYGYVIGGPNFEDSTARRIRNALREKVSDILTDYLKANQAP